MSVNKQFHVFLTAIFFIASTALAQKPQPVPEVDRPTGGIVDFLAPVLPDPVLQHSKEVYVLYGCAYCHGVDLKVRNGEAADLLHSPMVGIDRNANVLGPLLRNGIPQTAKLSPMPQFSDLSDREIADIVQWIHYARQQGRYKELMDATRPPPGHAALGKAYFDKTCASCHTQDDVLKIAKKYDPAALKAHILKPTFLEKVPSFKVGQLQDAKLDDARQQHAALLENYSAADVANLMAYFQSAK